jgi:8-oxo-dGTP pyrophosphatase MutT (NUDIX family)
MERISTLSNRSRKAQVWIGRNREGQGEVLLFRVIDRRGGGWHPVTGGVEKGEDFLAGAKREFAEETGFDPADGEWFDLEYSFRFEGRFGPAEERAYGFRFLPGADKVPSLDPGEHLEARWVGVEEALQWLGHQAQKDALGRFSCYLPKA